MEEWSVDQLGTLDFPIRDLPSTTDVQHELGARVQGHAAGDRGHTMMFNVAENLRATISVRRKSYNLVKTGGTAFYQGPVPLSEDLRSAPQADVVHRQVLQASSLEAVAVGHC